MGGNHKKDADNRDPTTQNERNAAPPMSESSQVKTVIDQLLTDEHEDLRNSVMAAYLENNKRAAWACRV